MTAFVALLRGVNVGKGRRVPMAEWRTMLEGLGYEGVATLLNSGNAVFRSTARSAPVRHAADIAAAVERELGLQVPVIVKSASEVQAIVEQNPFEVDAAEHSRFLVAFVQDAASLPALAAIEPLLLPTERFAIGAHAAYLHCADGILQSRAGEAFAGKIGRAVTTRNLATVSKLQALANGRA